MALGNQDRSNWFWRLPMTLLALRTTIKPDLGASPSDLVYGEGVSVPGQLLPSAPVTDEELLSLQRRTLSRLRMEVERMQPTPTSAHRSPSVHIPEDLNTCTHVFVRRGGVQPTLTTPYEGPFRVISRSPEGFRIDFPGRPSDIVALARLRPAIMASEEDDPPSQDANETPPTPPRPGRPPGLRSRVPEPTDRVTRSTAAQQLADRDSQQIDNEPIPCGSGATPEPHPANQSSGSPPPTPSFPDQQPIAQESPSAPAVPDLDLGSQRDDFDPFHAPAFPTTDPPGERGPPSATSLTRPPQPPMRRFTSLRERNFSSRGGLFPTIAPERPPPPAGVSSQEQGGAQPSRNRVLSFSRPQPGNFSHRRRRPDVQAVNAIIRSCLA